MNTLIAVGASGAALLAPAQATAAEQSDIGDTQHCVVDLDRGTTAECFDNFVAAEAEVARRAPGLPRSLAASLNGVATPMSSFVVAWHYEHHNGSGDSVAIVGSSCAGTWAPTGSWTSKLSSTRLGSSCSAAKHYTQSSCGGSYQIANAPFPSITNLGVPLNDNTNCVKYG